MSVGFVGAQGAIVGAAQSASPAIVIMVSTLVGRGIGSIAIVVALMSVR